MTTDTDKKVADHAAATTTNTEESGNSGISPPTTESIAVKQSTGTIAPPEQWPDAVKEEYDAIRTLGLGGFASVMLARHKTAPKDDPHKLVAIKIAGSKDVTNMDIGYARREIDIVRELSHPNVVKLIKAWEPPPDSKRTCAAVMALSYAKGPTVHNLLQHGGALSICFGRVVIAQLVDALAYLHSRAVVHRDIKPDNIIVAGASAGQDKIWQDDAIDVESVDWIALRKKWHLTLCDFGFARALGPEDLLQGKIAAKRGSVNLHDLDGSKHLDASRASKTGNLDSSRGSKSDVDKSVSHRFKRSMSALGNRLYAAPEIINGVNDDPNINIDVGSGNFDIMQTLSHHVSNYGMLADSYSLGNTMKYMMTGVQPDQNADEVVATMNNPIVKACMWMSNQMCKAKQSAARASLEKRTIQYRPLKKLPDELIKLIRGLVHPRVAQRTSIRAARRYFWIDEVLGEGTSPEMFPQTIDYLPCALKESAGVGTIAKEPDDEPIASTQDETRSGMDADELAEA